MASYHNNRAREILHTIEYATLATVTENNEPWNSPVYKIIDDEMNIYWISDKENQHSKNVRATGKVFIVVYDSTAPEGQGEGVYLQCNAQELTDPEEILKVRQAKKGADYIPSPGEFLRENIRRVYKATPIKAWMNDAEEKDGVFLRDFRVEIPLDILKQGAHD